MVDRHPRAGEASGFADEHALTIRSGDFLFVAGQPGGRDDEIPAPEFEQQVQVQVQVQVQSAFDKFNATRKAAGGRCDDSDPKAQMVTGMKLKNQNLRAPSHPSWTTIGDTGGDGAAEP